MRLAHTAVIVPCWVATRLPILAIALDAVPYPWPETIRGDIRLYEGWAEVLGQGRFPTGDWNWQYPPGAALAMLAPGWLPGGYLGGFLTVAALADLAVLVLLLRFARPGGCVAGAWAWVAGIPLLGPIAYARYDIVVAAIAVSAITLATRPVVSGALVGLGAIVKAWPALLLLGLPPGSRTRHTVGAAAVTCAALAVLLAVLLPGSLSFLTYQRGRGLQLESVPGTAFLVARHLGWDGTNPFRYGAREFVGPGVGIAGPVAPLLTFAALGWLLHWRRRAGWRPSTPPDAALTATLLAVVTSRVLSPQYMVWLVALAAVCLARRETGQRTVALLLLGCTALTQLEFPVLWSGVVHARLPADLVLLVRNAGLVCAAVLSARALWRSTVRAGDQDRASDQPDARSV
ncbi:MAG: glycosyltransferase 87 family protein [Gaiellaceae bacterium]